MSAFIGDAIGNFVFIVAANNFCDPMNRKLTLKIFFKTIKDVDVFNEIDLNGPQLMSCTQLFH